MQVKKAIVALINIFNPLPFIEAGDELTTSDLVRLFCPQVADVKAEAFIERYKKISSIAMEPPILPNLPILTEKIISPLLNSKIAFVAGNPLGTIALCGFVAEMIALMQYEMARDEGRAVDVMNDEFERWGQKKRVKILYEQNIIDQQTKDKLDVIRDIRNKYLHFISRDYSPIGDDALRVYSRCMWLLVRMVGQEFKDGAWIPQPSFARYLHKHGLL